MTEPKHDGLPVAGYKPQNEEAVKLVNENKYAEEAVLQILDELAARDDVDKRWLAVGRTQIEQGFMAVNRAVFQPERAKLTILKANVNRDVFKDLLKPRDAGAVASLGTDRDADDFLIQRHARGQTVWALVAKAAAAILGQKVERMEGKG